MEEKIDDGFLTCMQACDTISLMLGMDINSLIANGLEFTKAIAIVLNTDIKKLPVGMVKPIANVQSAILEFLEGNRENEDFNSGPWAKILNV